MLIPASRYSWPRVITNASLLRSIVREVMIGVGRCLLALNPSFDEVTFILKLVELDPSEQFPWFDKFGFTQQSDDHRCH